MKTPSYILIFLATLTPATFGTTPVQPSAADGQWKGSQYAVWVDSPDHLRAVMWRADKEAVPLPPQRAVAIARDALKKIVGDDHSRFDCLEASLRVFAGVADRWYYTVVFWSYHPSVAGKAGESIVPAILPFVVYLDGTVELPQKKKA